MAWLREQVEVADRDVSREGLKAEADRLWGAPGDEQPAQVNRGNACRPRRGDTRVGSIEPIIPKLPRSSYFPGWLSEPRRRPEGGRGCRSITRWRYTTRRDVTLPDPLRRLPTHLRSPGAPLRQEASHHLFHDRFHAGNRAVRPGHGAFRPGAVPCPDRRVRCLGDAHLPSLALIGDIFPMQKRQGAIGSFMGIAFWGQGLSMAIGGTIAFFVSWRGVFGLYALLSLVPTLGHICQCGVRPSAIRS